MNSTRYQATYQPREARREAARFANAIFQTEAARLGLPIETYVAKKDEAWRLRITVEELIAREKAQQEQALIEQEREQREEATREHVRQMAKILGDREAERFSESRTYERSKALGREAL